MDDQCSLDIPQYPLISDFINNKGIVMINYLLATQRVESTIGITLNRLFRYFKYAGIFLIATCLGAGTGFAGGSYIKSSGAMGLIGALIGFGLCVYFLHWSRRSRLYQFWAPHLILFGKLANSQTIPTGKQQLELGREQVQRLFDTPLALYSLYEKCAEVVSGLFINKYKLQKIAALPFIGDGLKLDFRVITGPLRDALLIDSLGSEITNPWQSLQDNLNLVSNRINSIQRSLLLVLAMQFVGSLLAFIVWYVGIDWLTDHWPDVDLMGWKLLLTGLLTWIMYAVFVYPIAVNAMLDEFLKIKRDVQDSVVESEDLKEQPAYVEITKTVATYTIPEKPLDSESQSAEPEDNVKNE